MNRIPLLESIAESLLGLHAKKTAKHVDLYCMSLHMYTAYEPANVVKAIEDIHSDKPTSKSTLQGYNWGILAQLDQSIRLLEFAHGEFVDELVTVTLTHIPENRRSEFNEEQMMFIRVTAVLRLLLELGLLSTMESVSSNDKKNEEA